MFDVEQFIIEVKRRHVLWDQSHADYNQRNSKLGAWEDVCANMYVDWSDLSNYDKFGKVRDIQNRWKNLRDNYMKELKYERKVEKGLALPKKNKYKYSHLLEFLNPGEKRKNRGSDQSSTDMEESEDNKEVEKNTINSELESSSPSAALGQNNNQVKLDGYRRVKRFKQSNVSTQIKLQSDSSPMDSDSNIQTVDKSMTRVNQNNVTKEMTQQLNNSMNLDCSNNNQTYQSNEVDHNGFQAYLKGEVSRKVKSEYLSPSLEVHSGFTTLPLEQDDDKMFLLSLLPYFKRLNEERKLQARIEMSTLLQKLIYHNC